MLRRVASRQRLVSWDSFDVTAAQPQGCVSSSDESSYDEDGIPVVRKADRDSECERDSGGGAASLSSSLGGGLPSVASPVILKRKRRAGGSTASPSAPTPSLTSSPSATAGVVEKDSEARASASSSSASPCSAEDVGLASLSDDVAAHVCGFLGLADATSLSQVSRRFREALRHHDHAWKVQAQHLWRGLPSPLERWNMERVAAGHPTTAADTAASGRDQPVALLRTPAQVLALASTEHPLPTQADATIFAPSRWLASSTATTRTLRSRTVVHHHAMMVRGSLHKELEVVPEVPLLHGDGGGNSTAPVLTAPAVRFLGPIGFGDRSIRANAPLPRPIKLVAPRPDKDALARRFWRSPSSLFLRRLQRAGASHPANDADANTPSQLQPCKWRPFVAPLRLKDGQRDDVWDVAPRLVSYFEVEILPPTAAGNGTAAGAQPHPVNGSAASSRYHRREPPGSLRHPHAKECVAVGLATDGFALHTRMPGWDQHSWGFHGDDAGLFHGAGTSVRESYGPTFGRGDVVGCGIDWVRECIFFTLNGLDLGTAFDLRQDPDGVLDRRQDLYPVVGVDTHDLVRLNLTGPFRYDLQQHKCREQLPAVRAALQQMMMSS